MTNDICILQNAEGQEEQGLNDVYSLLSHNMGKLELGRIWQCLSSTVKGEDPLLMIRSIRGCGIKIFYQVSLGLI